MHRLAPLLAAALAFPAAAAAWSDPGHRIVAAIAEERLSPAARRLVREIVGSKPLSDHEIATWADDVRDRRTGPWHYVNVPLSAKGYSAARDCPEAGCVVSALSRTAATLRAADSAADLADSLRWLVHLVADLHQPMHVGDAGDRGGNGTEVRLGQRRQPVTVHRLWDVEVLAPLLARSDPLRAAHALSAAIRPVDAAAWGAEGSPEAWADESLALARDVRSELAAHPVEGRWIVLPSDYPETQRARTVAALSKAGVRLAALLDRIASEREARSSGR
ncbi:MAG TPA: S1/P1 nuclease [Anaeromyxobacteraceae bacterium]|nr:S1/P1 nuclease [Anaeromyxobacteraceae bacterium]